VVWPVFLIAAMLGSVLTLASFLKLLHSIFLGDRPKGLERVREPGFSMWLPTVILALVCIGFGIFAYELPLKYFIYPSLPFGVKLTGLWSPTLATGLILLGLALGGVIYYWMGTVSQSRRRHIFIGGEELDLEEVRITGPHFYSSIREIGMLEKTYQFGEGGSFDLYNHFTGMMRAFGSVFKVLDRGIGGFYQLIARLANQVGLGLSRLHSGSLSLYLAWIFLGALIFWLVIW
jgi:NADH:ubiquinone oxidoreductase subunit 5 (subunit L)/multisubunit Na+/H+ antiporter MnhA subunit